MRMEYIWLVRPKHVHTSQDTHSDTTDTIWSCDSLSLWILISYDNQIEIYFFSSRSRCLSPSSLVCMRNRANKLKFNLSHISFGGRVTFLFIGIYHALWFDRTQRVSERKREKKNDNRFYENDKNGFSFLFVGHFFGCFLRLLCSNLHVFLRMFMWKNDCIKKTKNKKKTNQIRRKGSRPRFSGHFYVCFFLYVGDSFQARWKRWSTRPKKEKKLHSRMEKSQN